MSLSSYPWQMYPSSRKSVYWPGVWSKDEDVGQELVRRKILQLQVGGFFGPARGRVGVPEALQSVQKTVLALLVRCRGWSRTVSVNMGRSKIVYM
jgi:hypothetical protein